MKKLASLLFCLLSISFSAQNKTLTPEEAKAFFDNASPEKIMTLIFFEEEQGDKEFFTFYASKNPGEIIITGNDVLKVIGVKEIEVQSCGMFRLDDSNLSPAEIEVLHNTIIKKYRSGTSFAKLIEEYAVDKSPGQEDFMFQISEMNEQYKHIFNLHVNEEIFALYIPDMVNSIVVKNSPPEKMKTVIIEQAVFE